MSISPGSGPLMHGKSYLSAGLKQREKWNENIHRHNHCHHSHNRVWLYGRFVAEHPNKSLRVEKQSSMSKLFWMYACGTEVFKYQIRSDASITKESYILSGFWFFFWQCVTVAFAKQLTWHTWYNRLAITQNVWFNSFVDKSRKIQMVT